MSFVRFTVREGLQILRRLGELQGRTGEDSQLSSLAHNLIDAIAAEAEGDNKPLDEGDRKELELLRDRVNDFTNVRMIDVRWPDGQALIGTGHFTRVGVGTLTIEFEDPYPFDVADDDPPIIDVGRIAAIVGKATGCQANTVAEAAQQIADQIREANRHDEDK